MSTIALAKAAVRKELKLRLAAISPEDRQRQSKIVTEMVLNSTPYQKSKRVSIYLSLDEEVSTMEILLHIFKSGKKCFIPRYTQTNMEMLELKSWQDFQSLPLTKWNIRQPSGKDIREEALSSGGLDLILTPGLGFTTDGDRMGRGGGYYDKYLEKCAQTSNPPILIALAFKQQIINKIPSTGTDIKMDHVFHAP